MANVIKSRQRQIAAKVSNTIAIVYDFDGTLTPYNMQEYSFLPSIGTAPRDFWKDVKEFTSKHQADEILVYMYKMLDFARSAKKSIQRKQFIDSGKNIPFFDGVQEWFDRIQVYGNTKQVRIEHYLISSGNDEIIRGTPIAKVFKKIYASKYYFDENGIAKWPIWAVNFTTKTQFLFRINKDAHDLSDDKMVNRFVARDRRPVPFHNMIYIGDGSSDIPCFRLIKDLGGLSVAVYKARARGAKKVAQDLYNDGRITCFAPADYTDKSKLDNIVKKYIDRIASRVFFLKCV